MSDIDTVTVDSLKALDPNRPIREADIALGFVNQRRRSQASIENRPAPST